MSITNRSNFCIEASPGFCSLPSYSDKIGTPVWLSTELDTCSPASALPLKPCSGEKMATTLNLFSSSISNKCLSPTIPVWFEKMAIRFPFKRGKYSEVCSSPIITFDFWAWDHSVQHNVRSKSNNFFIILLLRD